MCTIRIFASVLCVYVCVCLLVCLCVLCVSVFCVCVTPLTLAAPDTLLSSEGRKLRNCLFCLKRMFQVCLALQLHTYVRTCAHAFIKHRRAVPYSTFHICTYVHSPVPLLPMSHLV